MTTTTTHAPTAVIQRNNHYVSSLASTVTDANRRTYCKPVRETIDANDAAGDFTTPFWNDRNYIKDAAKVKASVFLVHGMNDENVRFDHFSRFWYALGDLGVPRKAWLMQPDDGDRQPARVPVAGADRAAAHLGHADRPARRVGEQDLDALRRDPRRLRPGLHARLAHQRRRADPDHVGLLGREQRGRQRLLQAGLRAARHDDHALARDQGHPRCRPPDRPPDDDADRRRPALPVQLPDAAARLHVPGRPPGRRRDRGRASARSRPASTRRTPRPRPPTC